ncbi:MAG TPA: L,D-transpeptidase family protein [Pseudolabrys sp.]|nr:L,D-transpeptidase family protein [Pseudolabrys sp.]
MKMLPPARKPLHRRAFLKWSAALAGTGFAGAAMAAEDPMLQALIDQNQNRDFGQGFDSASRTIHMPQASLPTLSPSTADTTEKAIQQYDAIVARGGWPAVPPTDRLRLGNRHPSVVALRKRLAIAGDLEATAGTTDIFDSYVEAAVRRFQARHGLSVDGVLRPESYAMLNVPAERRLAQLKTNVVRLRSMSGFTGPRVVVCNIPAAQIEAIEGETVVSRHVAVVGKPDRPSPDINSRIVEVNFNPFWTVPVSIVRRDLIPKMQAEPDYLEKNRIRIFDQHHNELTASQINWYSQDAVHYMFKQDPGDFNSLGSIRINFPSNDGVYMHDTPAKNLFGEDYRFDSSGCVRVQNVRELVTWLLSETPGWSRQDIDAVIKSGERKDARLLKPVPLHWVYVTAWATPDNVVQFREDIYNRDGLGRPIAATSPG